MSTFDLNLLRVVAALDQTRHVGKAADQLGMSQSGFSTALVRLRKRLGDDLFVRTGVGMKPTPRGLALAETARSVLQQVEQQVLGPSVFEPRQTDTVFRVAMSDVGEVVFAPRLVQHLAQAAPQACLQVMSTTSLPLSERLAMGEVDLAMGYYPDLERDSFFRQALFKHSYACFVRKGHPVLRSGLTKAAYQTMDHAVVATPAKSNALLEKALQRHHIQRKVAFSSPHHLGLAATVAVTDLVATVPLGTAQDVARSGDLVVLPLPFRAPVFTLYQYWHRRTLKAPAWVWFRGQVKTLWGKQE